MKSPIRFQDKNYLLSDFYKEVWVICPSCNKKAIATVDFDTKKARLFCINCGFNKETTTNMMGKNANCIKAAHLYFDVQLWLVFPFKEDFFWALNMEHLLYLEKYIAANLREHTDRTHFTLLEKLPKFYHEAKNRETLLKIIEKLKNIPKKRA